MLLIVIGFFLPRVVLLIGSILLSLNLCERSDYIISYDLSVARNLLKRSFSLVDQDQVTLRCIPSKEFTRILQIWDTPYIGNTGASTL